MFVSLLAFAVSAGLGVHAFYHHRCESSKVVSAQRWIFGFYAAAFLIAGVTNYAMFLLLAAATPPQTQPLHLVYVTVLLLISYTVVLAGAKRKPF